jgi:UTP--glucose-1-phosphate uridylyltransferase
MHVLMPSVFQMLQDHSVVNGNMLPLTPSLQKLAEREKYLALEVKGNRYDISKKFGWLQAQVALGLAGQANHETLTTLVEMLAEANQRHERQ